MSEMEKQSAVGSEASGPRAIGPSSQEEGLDAGSRALAEALRFSFVVLKFVMLCILVVFIWSGFYTVGENEVALQLRFGKVQGVGEGRIKSPRSFPYWKWPNPIDEVIKVPAAKVERLLNINAFWYYEQPGQSPSQMYSHPDMPLKFVKDGYCLTASSGEAWGEFDPNMQLGESPAGAGTSARVDYNIAHTRWRVHYHIVDPLAFVGQVWDGTAGAPGERVGWYPVEKLIRNVVCDAVIQVSANWDIDDIIWKRSLDYREAVRRVVVSRLKDLEAGLEVTDLEYIDKSPPLQIKFDFDAATRAHLDREKLISEAGAKREEILNQAKADAKIVEAEAKSYSSTVEQAAKAEAAYLTEVLGKIDSSARERAGGSSNFEAAYRKSYDELLTVTLDQLYQETLRDIIVKADEVFVMPSTQDQPTEVRMHFSRDATLRPREAEEERK
jgi:membrane protease subunit HflK